MDQQIREYSGWLQTELGHESQEKIRMLATRYGLELDVGVHYIELEYQGRDTNRFVVEFLVDLAREVVDAEGEVRCETVYEGGDPSFEFFSIRGGKLARQRAVIVRDAVEIIE